GCSASSYLGYVRGCWIVHLLELAIDHFIRRLAEARPESLSMLVEAAEIVLECLLCSSEKVVHLHIRFEPLFKKISFLEVAFNCALLCFHLLTGFTVQLISCGVEMSFRRRFQLLSFSLDFVRRASELFDFG